VLARFLQTPTAASGEAIVPTPAAASCLCHALSSLAAPGGTAASARTMRKPDRAKLPAVAALLLSSDSRLLVRHVLRSLAAPGGRLRSQDDAKAEPAWGSRYGVPPVSRTPEGFRRKTVARR
jgi:hypothetical protein